VRARPSTRVVVTALLTAVLAAGCGVRPSAVITGGPAPTRPVRGAVLYLVADAALAPVLRPAPRDPSPAEVLALLGGGPTGDERAVGLTSEVPAALAPVTVAAGATGGVDVVVSVDVATLSDPAVDQIVCTVGDALTTTGPITLTGAGTTRGPRTCPFERAGTQVPERPGPPPR
jgi:hypothetical protein